MVSTSGGRDGGHDHTALDEIELAGELMIAATDSVGDRLPTERIDEVLLDRPDRTAVEAPGDGRPTRPDHDRRRIRSGGTASVEPGARRPDGTGVVPRPGGPAPDEA